MKPFLCSTLVATLLIGNVLNAFSQSRFSFSANLAPVYSNSGSSITINIPGYSSSEFNSKSNGLGYSIGIMGWYNFSTKWSVSTGIWATHLIVSKASFNSNGTSSSSTSKYDQPFSRNYKIPLMINYRSSVKKVSPFFSAGVSFGFRGTQYVYLVDGGERIPAKIGKAVVITPLIGAGLDYRLNDRLSLLIQPTFQYDVQPRPTYNYYHAYQLSLQTQLKWNL